MNKPAQKTISVRLNLGTYEQLEREALTRKISISQIIQEVIELREVASAICRFNR